MVMEGILKYWPIILFFLVGLGSVAHFLIKLYSTVKTTDEDHKSKSKLLETEIQGKLDIITAANKAQVELDKTKFETLNMVTNHLTRAGESIKNELSSLHGGIEVMANNIKHIMNTLDELKQSNNKK